MENFILWGSAIEPGASSLSFFATRMQIPCVGQGTREMIDKMLTEMGFHDIKYTDWSVRPFRNNYYSSADQPVSSVDAWSDTWEISLGLMNPASTEMSLPSDDSEIHRTYARDDTWDGGPILSPAPYVLIARFYNQILFSRAYAIFSGIHGIRDPELQDMVDRIKLNPLSSEVSAKQRAGAPMELTVRLGMFNDVTFEEKGARLAEQVSELIHELGATITWAEEADYRMERLRHSR